MEEEKRKEIEDKIEIYIDGVLRQTFTNSIKCPFKQVSIVHNGHNLMDKMVRGLDFFKDTSNYNQGLEQGRTQQKIEDIEDEKKFIKRINEEIDNLDADWFLATAPERFKKFINKLAGKSLSNGDGK